MRYCKTTGMTIGNAKLDRDRGEGEYGEGLCTRIWQGSGTIIDYFLLKEHNFDEDEFFLVGDIQEMQQWRVPICFDLQIPNKKKEGL